MIPASSLDFMLKAEASELDPEDPAEGFSGDGAEPQVFVRTISAPPGWPWEQARSADLEARHGAPLPLSELLYRVRRLEMWRPGAAARYAAFYVLARDVEDQLEAHTEVDGRRIAVTFGSGRAQGARAGRLALQGVVAAAVLLTAVASISVAVVKRGQAAAALDAAEQQVSAKLRRLKARDRQIEETRLLKLQLNRGTPLRSVIQDLGWVSAEKADDVHIEALHWRDALMALEVRGEQSPFVLADDRRVERAKRPVREGVWLWGIAPQSDEARLDVPKAQLP